MLASDLKSFIRSGGYCWPGGYPTALMMGDGEVIDCQAARENFRQILSALKHRGTNLQWEPYRVFIHWEGAPLTCAHSGREIESAYGEVGA
jgi:NAD(P)H-dependent FMN reductase